MTGYNIEQKAISMLKSKNFSPNRVALVTGLSLVWVELQAKKLGMVPLTVKGVTVG